MEEKVSTRYVFMMMLALSDRHGDVIGTDVAIARMMNVTKDEFHEALAPLLAPDLDSNSQAEEGRRLVPSENGRGYKVVNYECYRDMKSDEEKREYMRNYMRERRAAEKDSVKPVKKCKTQLVDVTHTEVEVDTNTDTLPPNPQRGDVGEDLPKRSRRLSAADKKRIRVKSNTPTMIRIGEWFGRQESTLWTIAEAEALESTNPSPAEIDGMEGYYSAKDIGTTDYRRKDLLTLLNNWPGELDRARGYYKERGQM